jgi:hypothetical protein
MKPAPDKTPHTEPEAKTSWADVARASAELQPGPAAALQAAHPAEDSPAVKESAFPGGNKLQPGDSVQHEKFGRCTVHRIVSGFVHMAPVNGRVIKLSQNIVTFTPAFIKDGRRVFSTSTRQ